MALETPDMSVSDDSYKELKNSLFLLSLPPTKDRSQYPRSTSEPAIALCILGCPKQFIDLLLEGGRCCPGDMMLVLSPSWLEKLSVVREDSNLQESGEGDISTSKIGPFHLFMKKAVTFHTGGKTYLDVFQPPRRVTYFINEMPERFDATDVDCATNGSQWVSAVLRNTLLWKMEMNKIGAAVPRCLVYCYKPSKDFIKNLQAVETVKLVELTVPGEKEEAILKNLSDFLSSDLKEGRQIVMERKIGGQICRSVFAYPNTPLVSLIQGDLQRMTSDDYFVIETQRLPKLRQKESLLLMTRSRESTFPNTYYNVFAVITVCRGLDDQLLLSEIYASLNLSTKCTTESTYHSLETTLGDLGITDTFYVDELEREIKRQARCVMNKVVNLEKHLNGLYIGPRTDFLEVEFNLQEIRGTLTPVLQDVSISHKNLNAVNEIWTRTGNYTSRLILHVMTMRSHGLLLKDKWILTLLLSVEGRKDFWLPARKYGVKVVLVTLQPLEDTESLVDMLIVYDMIDGSPAEEHARNILHLLKERNCNISGCVTMSCILQPLAAEIRESVGARGPSIEASQRANEKYLTYSSLWNSSSRRFTNKAFRVTSVYETVQACKLIDFPAFVKLEVGGGAVGAAMVTDEKHCLEYCQVLLDGINNGGEIFAQFNQAEAVIITEYIRGTEHSVEMVMFDGMLLVAYIRDVAPPNLPSFVPTSNSIPSGLPKDKQSSLIKASHQTCVDLGLRHGVFNVEMMFTPEGPKLIEINARLSAYVIQLLVKQCYDEDLTVLEYLINFGIRPTVVHLFPLRQAYTLLLRASQHFKQLTTPWVSASLQELNNNGTILYRHIRDIKMTAYDRVFAVVGVLDEDAEKAKQRLLMVAGALGLDTEGFPCSYFLSHL